MSNGYRSILDNGGGGGSFHSDELDWANVVSIVFNNGSSTQYSNGRIVYTYTTQFRGKLIISRIYTGRDDTRESPYGHFSIGGQRITTYKNYTVNPSMLSCTNIELDLDINTQIYLDAWTQQNNQNLFTAIFIPYIDQNHKYLDFANAVSVSSASYEAQSDGIRIIQDATSVSINSATLYLQTGFLTKLEQSDGITSTTESQTSSYFIPYAE